jgi:multidrug efflux pump subunit AcrA (membrane-fusion protein)
MDAATRNGLVCVALPDATELKIGGHVKGEIVLGGGEALALPESSVLGRDGYAFVYTVGADGTARLTRIETGGRAHGWVELSAGLTPESRVVNTGAGFVKDGDLVRVAPASKQRVAQVGDRRTDYLDAAVALPRCR